MANPLSEIFLSQFAGRESEHLRHDRRLGRSQLITVEFGEDRHDDKRDSLVAIVERMIPTQSVAICRS